MNTSTMNIFNQTANRINILLVDDNPDNLRLLSNLLTKYGYQTRRAISGKMAIAACKANKFDLIFLDINMPEMNGYEVCRQLKGDSQTAIIPVIFISALNEVLDKVKAFSVGGADYISKPFQFEEVIARVENQVQILSLQQELLNLSVALEEQVKERTKKLQIANEDLRKYQKQLLAKSLKDSVTNLDSTIAFMGKLRQAVKHLKTKSDYCFALIVFDCYCPQLIEEAFDLNIEDAIALEIAKKLSNSTHFPKIVARLRDWEFAIVLQRIHSKEQISTIAADIQQQLTCSLELNNYKFDLESHYGISFGTKNSDTPELLLKSARTIARQAQTKAFCSNKVML